MAEGWDAVIRLSERELRATVMMLVGDLRDRFYAGEVSPRRLTNSEIKAGIQRLSEVAAGLDDPASS